MPDIREGDRVQLKGQPSKRGKVIRIGARGGLVVRGDDGGFLVYPPEYFEKEGDDAVSAGQA